MPDSLFTPDGVAFLRSSEGARLLVEAARFPDAPAAVTALRKQWPREQVALAVETVALRRRACAKIAGAEEMFFTREAMEQASDSRIAAHRAQRYANFGSVADWGCGIGVDTLALAAVTSATGWDTDPVRIALARANAAALDRERALFQVGDYLTEGGDAEAVWADPGRRPNGRRVTDPAQYEPPLSAVVVRAAGRPLGVKVSPAMDARHIPADTEAEFISVGGELKEAVLWSNGLQTAERRATVLPSADTLVSSNVEAPIGPPGGFLYDPDPAVLRAGALSELALQLGAWRIDERVGYLSGGHAARSPFVQTLAIEAVMPWNAKTVKRCLRAQGLYVEEIRKRGIAGDVEQMRSSLKMDGHTPVVLVLTRYRDAPTAMLCTRMPSGCAE